MEYYKARKSYGFGGVLVAGNGNSGNVIAFRLSEAQLEKKIKEFREEYGEGQHGMVTWALFCDFLGYSELEVAECYQKGKEGKNAYSGRARLLEAFRTAVRGMTAKTCNKQQQLAKEEMNKDYLNLKKEGQSNGAKLMCYFGAKDDDRCLEAMK